MSMKFTGNTKKIVSVLLSIIMIIMCLSPYLTVSAKEIETAAAGLDSIIYEAEANEESFKPSYKDASGNEYFPESNNMNPNTNDLPSSYDSRDFGYVTGVRDQSLYGYSWSFASTAAIESNMLKNKLTDKSAEDLYISEIGQGYMYMTSSRNTDSIFHYDYYKDPRKGRSVGWPEYVAEAMADGMGPYENTLMPYDNQYDGYSDELRYYSLARLKDYEEYRLAYGVNDVLLKEAVYNNGGAVIHYNTEGYHQGRKSEYYYDNGNIVSPSGGHVVEVIGWDDNIDRTLFNPRDTENQPKHNGAWICKDSHSSDYADHGFIYISYDSINMNAYTFVTQSVDTFDKIYQYGAVADCYIKHTVANIFTSERDETLEQICFMNMNATSGKIKIYKLNDGYTSPIDGTLLDEQEFSYNLTGLHCVDTVNNIELKKGDVFSVVVSPDKGVLACSTKENTLDIKNVGFYSTDGINFTDVKSADNQYAVSYPYVKAYTKIKGQTDKEELISTVDAHEKMDRSLCLDKNLLEQYDLEAQKASEIIKDDSAKQSEIDNEVCLMNNYYNLCAKIFEINSKEDLLLYYNESVVLNSLPRILVLNCDLDMSGEEIDSSLTYQKTFNGVFLGNNHTISNLTINTFVAISDGLFGTAENALIKDLKIKDSNINGLSGVGAIAGELSGNCTISNCSVEDSFIYTIGYDKSSVGAIVGKVTGDNNKIENCSSTGNDIRGRTFTGGIIGSINSETVNNSVVECSASNNLEKGMGTVSKTYPNDPDSFTLSVYATDEAYKGCESLATLDDNGAYIQEYTGKIESITNAEFDEDKWNVIVEGINKECEITYSEDYKGIFELKFNFEDETVSIHFISADETIEELIFPNKFGAFPVRNIDDIALSNFQYKDKIKRIVSEDGISFDNVPFTGFVNLETVDIGEGTTIIDFHAFENLQSLKRVTLPDSLKLIQGYAFAECKNLETVDFGNKLEAIKGGAFMNCSSLKNVVLPDSLSLIASESFEGCNFCKIMLGNNPELNIISKPLGYLNKKIYDDDGTNERNIKIDSFVINGYTDSAKKYAEENGFKYVDLNNEQPDFDDTMFDMSIFKAGDSDLDGNITIVDATVIQKYLAKAQEIDDYQRYNMLVKDCEKSISIANATVVQKYLAKIIDTLDYES